jgi:hypothetical protein
MPVLPLTFGLFVILYLEIGLSVCHITLIIIYHNLPLYEI